MKYIPGLSKLCTGKPFVNPKNTESVKGPTKARGGWQSNRTSLGSFSNF